MPYARFIQVSEQIGKAEKEDYKRLAFVGWQVQALFTKPEERVTFKAYLSTLFNEEGNGPEPVKATKEAAIKKAEGILDKYKGQWKPQTEGGE